MADAGLHLAPRDARRGALVLVEAPGAPSAGLASLADGFAEDGYEAVVPALPAKDAEAALPGLQAVISGLSGPVFLAGFGWGGTLAWLAAARLEGLAAVAVFYPQGLASFVGEAPRRPTIVNLARQGADAAEAEALAERHPDLPVFPYDAPAGFMAPGAPQADCARLARLRTSQLFHRTTARGEAGG